MANFRKLIALFNRRERWQIAGLLGVAGFMGLLEVASVGSIAPFLNVLVNPDSVDTNPALAWLRDVSRAETERGFLIWLGSGVLALLIASNVFMALTLWLISRFSWRRQHALAVRLLTRYMSQPYVAFLNRNTASMSKNILSELNNVAQFVLLQYLRLATAAVTIVFILGFLFWYQPVFSLVAAVLLGGAYGIIFVTARRTLARSGRQRVAANDERYRLVNEAFGGIKDVKLLGREQYFVSQFAPASWRFSQASILLSVLPEVPRFALEAVAFGGLLLVLLVLLILEGSVQGVIPVAGVFAFGTVRLLPVLQQAFTAIARIRGAEASLDTIYEDLRPKPDVLPRGDQASRWLPFKQEIRMEAVSYQYPNTQRQVVSQLNLAIPHGASVAFVGTTGAGKTTLVDLILGLLRPTEGRLTVDGVELDDTNLRAWQDMLGYVPQHIYLSDDTIAHNIAFGVRVADIDMNAVERAARTANIHQFVTNELPNGYDTMVGERGVRLSGGQRQRIGIARALYHDPEVLVLDEATSSLDGATEESVQKAITQAAAAKTLILIAHRLSTVLEVDSIFLVEDAQIVAQGTYQEMMANNAGFRALARASV